MSPKQPVFVLTIEKEPVYLKFMFELQNLPATERIDLDMELPVTDILPTK